MYDKLGSKVDNIDTNDFVLKNKYQTDKTELENEIPDVSNLVTYYYNYHYIYSF